MVALIREEVHRDRPSTHDTPRETLRDHQGSRGSQTRRTPSSSKQTGPGLQDSRDSARITSPRGRGKATGVRTPNESSQPRHPLPRARKNADEGFKIQRLKALYERGCWSVWKDRPPSHRSNWTSNLSTDVESSESLYRPSSSPELRGRTA